MYAVYSTPPGRVVKFSAALRTLHTAQHTTATTQRLPTHHTDSHTVHTMKFAACGLVAAASLIASTSAQCTSHLSCAELNSLHGGWPTGRGSALVCGESDNGIALDADSEFTGCFGGSAVGLDDGHTRTVVPAPVEGWEDGSIICRAMGARLCTVEELGADETRHPRHRLPARRGVALVL